MLVIVPPVVLREPLVPAGVEQGVPRGPRPHRDEPHHAAGGPRRRAGRAGVRPRARRSPRGSSETNEDQYDANIETVRISAKYFPIVEYAGVAGTAVIVGFGGWLRRRRASSTVGTVAAFVLYLNNLFEPIHQLSQLYNTVQSAGAALQKIFGVLDTQPSIDERPGAVDLPGDGRDRGRRTCTFALRRERAACCTTCRCTSRRASGSRSSARPAPGKSTLAKLIARFYDPREGAVRVGGVDLRDATMRSLRERIVVVPQEGFLFAGTLRDNVRVGRPEATDAEVDDALDALGLLERFARVPRRARHRGARARVAPVGGRAPARLARPRRARRPGGARARRGDVEPRPRHRAHGRARARAADARPHRDRRRAPPVDRGPRRPHRRGRRRAGSPSSARTTSWSRTKATTRACTRPGTHRAAMGRAS